MIKISYNPYVIREYMYKIKKLSLPITRDVLTLWDYFTFINDNKCRDIRIVCIESVIIFSFLEWLCIPFIIPLHSTSIAYKNRPTVLLVIVKEKIAYQAKPLDVCLETDIHV